MFFVYVLKSLRNKKRYIGYSSKEPQVRLAEHNVGANQWTRQNGPFGLVYYETFSSKTEAIKRENFLKSGQGKKWLDEKLITSN